jgi:imidazolonepropionase
MSLMVALACVKMRMTPEEAFNAATINTAAALEILESHGSITKGKVANVFITKKIPSLSYIPYSFGSQLVDQVILGGKLIA